MANLTYKQLADFLQTVIKEDPSIGEKKVVVHQTDRFSRQISHVQLGFGGDCLIASRVYEEQKSMNGGKH